jgi:hypothetical protein
LFGVSGLLKDETLDLLSSVGPFPSRERLEKVLAGQWKWYSRYGEELFVLLSSLKIPPMKPLPKKSRIMKRKHGTDANSELLEGPKTGLSASPVEPKAKKPHTTKAKVSTSMSRVTSAHTSTEHAGPSVHTTSMTSSFAIDPAIVQPFAIAPPSTVPTFYPIQYHFASTTTNTVQREEEEEPSGGE